MRKEYSKALRALFTKKLNEIDSNFKEIKVANGFLQPGERAYQWEVNDRLYCFIILVPDRSGADSFTVEIGWSTKARFPQIGFRPLPASLLNEEFVNDEYVFRLPIISMKKDFWWQVGEGRNLLLIDPIKFIEDNERKIDNEEAMKNVLPHVEDAIRHINNYGIPFLKKVIGRIDGIDELDKQ
jgi:hypothetical protein